MTSHSLSRIVEVYSDVTGYPTISSVLHELGFSNNKQLYRKLAQARRDQSIPDFEWRDPAKKLARQGDLGFDPVLPGFEVRGVSTEIHADGETGKSWVSQAPAFGKKFEMPEGQVPKGISVLVDQEGREIAKWIKTREAGNTEHLIESLRTVFSDYRGLAPKFEAPALIDDDHLTIYPLVDLHYGMRAMGSDVGEDYNCKIAAERARSMVNRLVAASPSSETAILLGLGDFFHINDRTNATPAHKHQLDVDGTYPQIVAGGIRLMLDLISLTLQKHNRVIVRMIPGNHDPESIIALTVALSAFYHDEERVFIDDNASDHWFYRFGKNLFGATHGHTMKPDRMAMMLATDCTEDWGLTLFKYVFFGHIHHETVVEVGPVRCESFNTPASKDKHAYKGGYRSSHSMVSMTFNKDHGEVERRKVSHIPTLA